MSMVKTQKIKNYSKEVGGAVSLSKFALAIQSIALRKLDKNNLVFERAYQNKLMLTTPNINKDTKNKVLDILTKIVNDAVANAKSVESENSIIVKGAYKISTTDYTNLKFMLPTIVDSKIDTTDLTFTDIKNAITSAYEIKMRRA